MHFNIVLLTYLLKHTNSVHDEICECVNRFDATPELNYKDVPWPFGLKPADVELTKTECFSAVSEEELRVSYRLSIHCQSITQIR